MILSLGEGRCDRLRWVSCQTLWQVIKDRRQMSRRREGGTLSIGLEMWAPVWVFWLHLSPVSQSEIRKRKEAGANSHLLSFFLASISHLLYHMSPVKSLEKEPSSRFGVIKTAPDVHTSFISKTRIDRRVTLAARTLLAGYVHSPELLSKEFWKLLLILRSVHNLRGLHDAQPRESQYLARCYPSCL